MNAFHDFSRNSLTAAQFRVYGMICYLADKGESITYRKLGALLGIGSPNGVRAHLVPLLAKGLITGIDPGKGKHNPNKKCSTIRPLYCITFLEDNAEVPPKPNRTGDNHGQDSGRRPESRRLDHRVRGEMEEEERRLRRVPVQDRGDLTALRGGVGAESEQELPP